MKKALPLFLIVALLVGLVGCSSESVQIEDHEWELTLIQSTDDGSVIGCASEHYEMHKEIDDIIVVDLTCSAADGAFTIKDRTNNSSYEGTYAVKDKGTDSTIYTITTASSSGTAVTSVTTADSYGTTATETPTLIITIGEYTLSFQAE